ncbi:hypothetical protein GCM10017674_24850 [Streptomyces gardneri]|uniref:Uncharacterized protein n=1 Tax=Streptomyces gardneri TaxID=66892 RepID=A0A4Y3RP99_9ACTN|nr:hypothetical protein SGA01_52960 [Streptomyces gardneri]GHG94387.1 hypothetical protein GCM10017674_24850 [Streptomyces gardneri]
MLTAYGSSRSYRRVAGTVSIRGADATRRAWTDCSMTAGKTGSSRAASDPVRLPDTRAAHTKQDERRGRNVHSGTT